MSEVPVDPTEKTVDDFRDIHDAVELAFWGVEFSATDAQSLPISLSQNLEVCALKERTARGYDAVYESQVEVLHVRGELEEDGTIVPMDIVMIFWGNEFTILLDLREDNIGHYASEDDPYLDEPVLKQRAKVGLAAVDSILD